MRINWKSTIRILAIAAMTIGFLPSLPAAASAHGGENSIAAAQDQDSQAQKQEPEHRKKAAAPQSADEQGEAGQAEDQQPEKQQLEQIRQQVSREMMDRMRYGSAHTDIEGMLDGFLALGAWIGFLVIALWVLRLSLDHKRWSRAIRTQSEVQTKLLDKLGTSQDLIAYVESEAGKRFFEAPIFESQARQTVAVPYGRILWSVQVGVIAAVLGIGILLLRGKAPSPDADLAFEVFGTLTSTLGVGFLISGGVSYVLARYMGLTVRPEDAKPRTALQS